jgi:hypothetical protein
MIEDSGLEPSAKSPSAFELLTGGQREDITFFEIGPGFCGHTTGGDRLV